MSDEVLRLRGVGVRRDRSALIRDVDWTVRSGESWVVIGPNGAGKTTLLRVLAGELPPAGGTVTRGPGVRVAHVAPQVDDPDGTVG